MTTRRPVEALLKKWDTAIDLEFARVPSGAVHVMVPDDPDERSNDGDHVPWGQVASTIHATRTLMVCGVRVRMDAHGGRAVMVERFSDDDLCPRCVKGLGSQSARAFEHPQPTDKESGS